MLSVLFTLIYPGHWFFSPVFCVVMPSSIFYPGSFSFGVTGTTVHAVFKQKVISLHASDRETLDQEAGCRHLFLVTTSTRANLFSNPFTKWHIYRICQYIDSVFRSSVYKIKCIKLLDENI